MHKNSIEQMNKFALDYLNGKKNIRVLDVGSYDTSGIYRKIFKKDSWSYIGLDIRPGPNVDYTTENPYSWDIEDNSFNVVISGQTFEHIEYPWLTLQEMARVLTPGGLICVIAPSAWKEHQYPLDCWRILPDGMRGMARLAKLEVLDCYNSEAKNKYWQDCILICRKGEQKERKNE